MILNIDTTGKEISVTKDPEAKIDSAGAQRRDRTTDLPMWSTQVAVVDDSGGEIIKVATHAEVPPDVERGDMVIIHGLVAIPWMSNGRSGVAYRAEKILADETE